MRARVIQLVRKFFAARDYLEVETPCRIPAPAPEANIEAQASGEWYLHTSPELCMKRLLAAGFPKIFQICRCFRTGERGRKHLPELTMLEWYAADIDYREMMNQCESMIQWIARQIGIEDDLDYQQRRISLTSPWR